MSTKDGNLVRIVTQM